jgi:DNA-directed RNA polymerase specialized sigma24 family protein
MGDSRRTATDEPKPACRQDDFESLLERLDADREAAGQKYEGLRRRLIKFFEWNRCEPVEDLADETLDRVARRLARDDVEDVIRFAWGVAQHVRQESERRMRREVAIPDLPRGAQLRGPDDVEGDLLERLLDERRARCFRACLRRLPRGQAELFVAYYQPCPDPSALRQQLSEAEGLSIRGLRVRINRLRQQLEDCVSRCLAGAAPARRRPAPSPNRGRR